LYYYLDIVDGKLRAVYDTHVDNENVMVINAESLFSTLLLNTSNYCVELVNVYKNADSPQVFLNLTPELTRTCMRCRYFKSRCVNALKNCDCFTRDAIANAIALKNKARPSIDEKERLRCPSVLVDVMIRAGWKPAFRAGNKTLNFPPTDKLNKIVTQKNYDQLIYMARSVMCYDIDGRMAGVLGAYIKIIKDLEEVSKDILTKLTKAELA
jgi:hypothetical protein